jgi:hypothetical protein
VRTHWSKEIFACQLNWIETETELASESIGDAERAKLNSFVVSKTTTSDPKEADLTSKLSSLDR